MICCGGYKIVASFEEEPLRSTGGLPLHITFPAYSFPIFVPIDKSRPPATPVVLTCQPVEKRGTGSGQCRVSALKMEEKSKNIRKAR